MSIRLYLDLDRGLYLLPHEGSPVSAGACRHVVSEMCAVMCLGRRRPPAEAAITYIPNPRTETERYCII